MAPTNDPVNDRYDPPGNLSQDFEKFTFGELENNELFWQTNQPGENIPWRKVRQKEAMNLKTRATHNFDVRAVVYQKV